MNNERIVKEAKVIMGVTLIVGIVFLAVGLLFIQLDVSIISNNKALIGLSVIPLSTAIVYFIKLTRIKKSSKKMRSIIIKESDERLVALNNEADAKTFKILKGALFLTYCGYTFMVPEDVFKSVGWWILIIILLGSLFLQGMIRDAICKANSKDNNEE